MRILVSEYLCGGSWPEAELPESLAREGRAMLEAVCRDLADLPETTVLTTWDRRLPPPEWENSPRLEWHQVATAEEEQAILISLIQQADAALVIAPEFDHLLEQRCRQVLETGRLLLNCTPEAIQLCADKLQLYEHCCRHQIPTIPTMLVRDDPPLFPCVVKLRDGAGSQGMRLLETAEQWQRWRSLVDSPANRKSVKSESWIAQPYLSGRSCSVAAICQAGMVPVLLPAGEQHFSEDGTFQYLGGSIPASGIDPARFEEFIRRTVASIPGLYGYVGFDILLAENDTMLLVEVNPRLSTSYVGYRQLCRDNLAHWLVTPAHLPAPAFSGAVQFQADGTILEKSL